MSRRRRLGGSAAEGLTDLPQEELRVLVLQGDTLRRLIGVWDDTCWGCGRCGRSDLLSVPSPG